MEYVKMKIVDGILIAEFSYGLQITKEIAQEMVEARLEFQKGKTCPIVIISNGCKIDSGEARQYLKKEGIKGLKSGCFVVNNYFEKTVINFFLVVKPPEVPSKMFTDLEEAIAWSKQHK
jgi:hypothetical protein